MTESTQFLTLPHSSVGKSGRLRRRYVAERGFQAMGLLAVGLSLGSLVLLLAGITMRGIGAFRQSEVQIEVALPQVEIDPQATGDLAVIGAADFGAFVKASLRERFPDVTDRRAKRSLYALVSVGATYELRQAVLDDPDLIGTRQTFTFPLSADADMWVRGHVDRDLPAEERTLSDDQIAWVDALTEEGRIETVFNSRFLTSGDSREPELAGILGALLGSALTLLVTLALCLPLGIASAVYLESFAPKNRWVDLIEVNINNLAAVPSIVFGLLGLAVFLGFFQLPRSAPLVGGLVLALMTLPTVIITGRSAISAVPPSITEAALGMGASRMQAVLHHVLPLAMPGILTGTIIGIARALGESAPLLMVGMVAFIADIPSKITSPATVLPVQIFLWADAPERAFVEKTAGAILVLLGVLVAFNMVAVILRTRLSRRW